MHKKRTRRGQAFWDAEYKEGGHLALSFNPSEDLEKFVRFIVREHGRTHLNVTSSVLDLGCGNGRNLIWLSENFGVHGIGYDSSTVAIGEAKRRAAEAELPLQFEARTIAPPIPLPDNSKTLVLDMMTSHFLSAELRVALIREIFRILKPGGFFFYKTFLLDEDMHAKRLLRENPAEEKNTYMHPKIGVAEHVSTEDEIVRDYGAYFSVLKIQKSHRHRGKGAKRRSISVYLQKPEF